MLERCPRRAEVVLLTHEFAIGLPPVLRDGYRHFLRAANLRLLHLDQDLTNSLRGIKRQNQRLFTRLCGNPATCPRSSLTVERIVDRMARIFRANEHRRDSGDILLGGATRRRGLMCCQNFFAQQSDPPCSRNQSASPHDLPRTTRESAGSPMLRVHSCYRLLPQSKEETGSRIRTAGWHRARRGRRGAAMLRSPTDAVRREQ